MIEFDCRAKGKLIALLSDQMGVYPEAEGGSVEIEEEV
jgi:hypothetical protein